MKNNLIGLFIMSLVFLLYIAPGCQAKPKEEAQPAREGKEIMGEAAETGQAASGTMMVADKEGAASAETAAEAASDDSGEGEALYKKHCAICHPDGGNIINSKKTLHKNDLDASNIKTAEDIVKTMRNPGPGMTKFPEEKISNEDATKIAEYILKTFQ
jgi:cytochrome c6